METNQPTARPPASIGAEALPGGPAAKPGGLRLGLARQRAPARRRQVAAELAGAAGGTVAAMAFAGDGIDRSRAAGAFLAEREGRRALPVAHALRGLAEAAAGRGERLRQMLAFGDFLFRELSLVPARTAGNAEEIEQEGEQDREAS
jgi:hypothetical protein